MRRLGVPVAIAFAVAFVACSMPGDENVTVRARFPDVGDLARSAPVMMADVQIGKVTDIALEQGEALVTMEVSRSARVPHGVAARVRRTSLLGERIVDFVIPPEVAADAPLLQDGDRITQTEYRADLEDLVEEGTDVLAPIAASEVATMVNEGGEGFGGRGEELGTMLRNFSEIVDAYASRSHEIRGVISSLNEFNSTLATRSEAHARSVQNSAQALGMLAEESDRLRAAIHELARLSIGARSLLEEHSDEMARFFAQMRTILDVLRQEEESIEGILHWAPGHNYNTQTTEYKEFVQVLQDIVFCGMNDDPEDPARSCERNPSSR